MVYNFGRVCLSVCLSVRRCFNVSSYLHIRYTGQVGIWRSSGQGQGHISKKDGKSLFPQCKTSIGNNSGSIKHRAIVCMYMGFSTMADQMWPPSLSRDGKWPPVTKCTHTFRGWSALDLVITLIFMFVYARSFLYAYVQCVFKRRVFLLDSVPNLGRS